MVVSSLGTCSSVSLMTSVDVDTPSNSGNLRVECALCLQKVAAVWRGKLLIWTDIAAGQLEHPAEEICSRYDCLLSPVQGVMIGLQTTCQALRVIINFIDSTDYLYSLYIVLECNSYT